MHLETQYPPPPQRKNAAQNRPPTSSRRSLAWGLSNLRPTKPSTRSLVSPCRCCPRVTNPAKWFVHANDHDYDASGDTVVREFCDRDDEQAKSSAHKQAKGLIGERIARSRRVRQRFIPFMLVCYRGQAGLPSQHEHMTDPRHSERSWSVGGSYSSRAHHTARRLSRASHHQSSESPDAEVGDRQKHAYTCPGGGKRAPIEGARSRASCHRSPPSCGKSTSRVTNLTVLWAPRCANPPGGEGFAPVRGLEGSNRNGGS